jgi:hypothetical protein
MLASDGKDAAVSDVRRLNPTLIAVNPVSSVRGNVVNKLLSAYKLASFATPVSVSDEILLFSMFSSFSFGKVTRVRDDRRLLVTVSVSKFGKPDKVRLVNRLDEISKERSSGKSLRLNDVNMFPDKPMSCSFVDPKVTDVNLLFPADKPSRTVNFETSSVES